jgi:LPXTG-motif cell wall-anchored protein
MKVKRIVCGLGAVATMGAVTLVGFGAQSASAANCVAFPYTTSASFLTVSTEEPAAGQTIQVSGCGFTPGATVSLFLFSHRHFLGNVIVDPSGGFDFPVSIPWFFCGPHRIVAIQQAPQKRAEARIFVSDCRGHGRGDFFGPGRFRDDRGGDHCCWHHRRWHHRPWWARGVREAAEASNPLRNASNVDGTRGLSFQSESRDVHTSVLPRTGAAEAFGIASVGAAVLAGGVLVVSRRRRDQD